MSVTKVRCTLSPTKQPYICRLVRRTRATGCVADRPRSERSRVTSPRQDHAEHVRFTLLRNRHLTAAQTAQAVIGVYYSPIHLKIVLNRPREHNIRSDRPDVGPHVAPGWRARRMRWLTAHAPRRFTMRRWRSAFFTDESRLDDQRRVFRRPGEPFADICVIERGRFGSVMVWGVVSQGSIDLWWSLRGIRSLLFDIGMQFFDRMLSKSYLIFFFASVYLWLIHVLEHIAKMTFQVQRSLHT